MTLFLAVGAAAAITLVAQPPLDQDPSGGDAGWAATHAPAARSLRAASCGVSVIDWSDHRVHIARPGEALGTGPLGTAPD